MIAKAVRAGQSLLRAVHIGRSVVAVAVLPCCTFAHRMWLTASRSAELDGTRGDGVDQVAKHRRKLLDLVATGRLGASGVGLGFLAEDAVQLGVDVECGVIVDV